MTRLPALLRGDVRLQYRYGLYAVSGVIVLVWGVLLSLLPETAELSAALIVPAFLVSNLIVTTFFFMGALLLLEKGDGVLEAIVTTPVRDVEYLLSKVISLTFLALAESLLIAALLFGVSVHWGPLLAGAVLLGAFYTLAGFIFVVRYDSINELLIPSVGLVAVLLLPLLPHFGLTGRLPFYFHPVEPAMTLLRAAYRGAASWEIVYGVIGALAWCAASFLWARRRFRDFVVRAAGT
ncbi:MAG TPA: ABC transporter permease [Thermoanaerobaculia bacterium]